MSCGGRNFRFRVVVTKIVETLRPPPEGGAHLGHVFRGQGVRPGEASLTETLIRTHQENHQDFSLEPPFTIRKEGLAIGWPDNPAAMWKGEPTVRVAVS